MAEILWHRRETRRQTEKTNICLNGGKAPVYSPTVSDAFRIMMTRIACEHVLPFEPLIPNEETIAAMRAARKGETETVTLDQLQSVLDADN